MQRACAGHAARQDLAAIRQVAPQAGHVLVVDEVDVLQAEAADLAPAAVEVSHQNGMSSGSTSPPTAAGAGPAPPATPAATVASAAGVSPRLSRNCTSDALTSVL